MKGVQVLEPAVHLRKEQSRMDWNRRKIGSKNDLLLGKATLIWRKCEGEHRQDR